MTHQHAVTVVAAPLETVERALQDVAHWPRFLLGVEQVAKVSHGRYTFVVRDRSSVREVDVAVVAHPGEHRVGWHALAGPRFDGEIRLAAVAGGRTRVSLSRTADPAGFLASLADLARMGHDDTAALDLQRLEAVLTGPTES